MQAAFFSFFSLFSFLPFRQCEEEADSLLPPESFLFLEPLEQPFALESVLAQPQPVTKPDPQQEPQPLVVPQLRPRLVAELRLQQQELRLAVQLQPRSPLTKHTTTCNSQNNDISRTHSYKVSKLTKKAQIQTHAKLNLTHVLAPVSKLRLASRSWRCSSSCWIQLAASLLISKLTWSNFLEINILKILRLEEIQ